MMMRRALQWKGRQGTWYPYSAFGCKRSVWEGMRFSGIHGEVCSTIPQARVWVNEQASDNSSDKSFSGRIISGPQRRPCKVGQSKVDRYTLIVRIVDGCCVQQLEEVSRKASISGDEQIGWLDLLFTVGGQMFNDRRSSSAMRRRNSRNGWRVERRRTRIPTEWDQSI